MVKQTKTSTSSQPTAAPLATVEGSLLANSTNTNYLAFISANAAAARLMGQKTQDDIDPVEPDDDPGDPGDPGEPNEPGETNFSVPQLSDIQVVSNEVVIDNAGLPSAKVVFKIRNSSGVDIKAVEVRYDKK